jgi:hypothetical protein
MCRVFDRHRRHVPAVETGPSDGFLTFVDTCGICPSSKPARAARRQHNTHVPPFLGGRMPHVPACARMYQIATLTAGHVV